MNYFIAKGKKNGKDTIVRFDKSQFDKEKATELLNNNEVKNFFFHFEPAAPVELDENTFLFSGEVGFDITLEILLPYIKAEKTIALNSAGGYNSDAMLIHDYIKNFKPNTKQLIMGNCMSATNQIFLASKLENRQATRYSKFLIHNGWVMMEGDHNELRTVANMLEKETSIMTDLYVKESGKPREEITELMEKEEILNCTQALELNFISKIKSTEETPQTTNINNNDNMDKGTEQKEALAAFDKVAIFFKNLVTPAVKNIVLSDTNGLNYDFNVETEAEIVEGVSVTLDGAPFTGTIELPNNTIVAEAGLVTSNTPKEMEEEASAEVAQLTQEVANLKAEKLELKNKFDAEIEKVKALDIEKAELSNKVLKVENSFKAVNEAYEKVKNTFSDGAPKSENKPEVKKEENNNEPLINFDKIKREKNKR